MWIFSSFTLAKYFLSETLHELSSFGKELQIILKLPESLDMWPERTGHKKEKKVSLKIAIQDGNKFPSFTENIAHLEVGYFHKILVSHLNLYPVFSHFRISAAVILNISNFCYSWRFNPRLLELNKYPLIK